MIVCTPQYQYIIISPHPLRSLLSLPLLVDHMNIASYCCHVLTYHMSSIYTFSMSGLLLSDMDFVRLTSNGSHCELY